MSASSGHVDPAHFAVYGFCRQRCNACIAITNAKDSK